jgi:hypothetical protein
MCNPGREVRRKDFGLKYEQGGGDKFSYVKIVS